MVILSSSGNLAMVKKITLCVFTHEHSAGIIPGSWNCIGCASELLYKWVLLLQYTAKVKLLEIWRGGYYTVCEGVVRIILREVIQSM